LNELQTLAEHCLRDKERSKVDVFGKESRMKAKRLEVSLWGHLWEQNESQQRRLGPKTLGLK